VRVKKANVSTGHDLKGRGIKPEIGETKEVRKVKAGKEEWLQVSPGKFFIETVHEKGKRWPDHAFDEILILEEGLEGVFSRVEGVGMLVECGVHEERWAVGFWVRC
jgi:hypothetical protein